MSSSAGRRAARRVLAVVVVAASACGDLGVGSTPALAPPPPAPEPANASESADCTSDRDCVLLPSMLTCCKECPPAPPFEPVPTWVFDGMLIEQETWCATQRTCPDRPCEVVPESCEAHAMCVAGRCAASATGCELPVS